LAGMVVLVCPALLAGGASEQDGLTTSQSTGSCAQGDTVKPQNETASPFVKEIEIRRLSLTMQVGRSPAKPPKDITPPASAEKSAAKQQDGSVSPLSREFSKKATTERSTGPGDGKLSTETEEAKPPVIVMGFMGGFVGHDNMAHSPAQIAARLRDGNPGGVYVKVFENHRREDAHREILNLLDTHHDGNISAEEKQQARIIIYGVSWGGSEAVALAKELDREGIPVLLTVQVDSVAKMGQNDQMIPANVREAANFYQADGLLRGQPKIQAADATRTKILGNYRMEYKTKSVACHQYPWYDKLFVRYHTEIECDPAVWNQVESLIREKLPAAEERQAAVHEEKSKEE